MTWTPGDPLRDREVNTNSFAKSYVPVAVALRKRTPDLASIPRSGVGASLNRPITSALAARRSRRRSSCQNPSLIQPTDTASATSVKKTVALRTFTDLLPRTRIQCVLDEIGQVGARRAA